MRDLFIRHDRLSMDQVERLKKRIESNSIKLESIKQTKKEGWEDEVERLTLAIERDQATIAAQLHRRVFIRAWFVRHSVSESHIVMRHRPGSMWHELRVVLHNRENTILTQTIRAFARGEQEHSERVSANWVSLVDIADSMPLE